MEQLFSGKGFSGMSEEDKRRFLDAVTGEDGKVNSHAAAALIAAAASGGDPELAEKIVEKMMSGLGGEDAEIDPAMMAALMATTAMAAQGASNEEVSRQARNLHYYNYSTILHSVVGLVGPEKSAICAGDLGTQAHPSPSALSQFLDPHLAPSISLSLSLFL